MARFAVVLTPDLHDGGYTVTVPALPGIVTDGETVDEALAMAREAIDLHMDGLGEDQLAASGARFDLQIEFVEVPALSERRSPVSSAAG